MAKVHLHGIFDVYGKPLQLSVSSAQEAAIAIVAHLQRTHPEVFKDKVFFQIKGYDNLDSLTTELPSEAELHFMPAFNAGKKAGVFQVVLGAVLIGGAILFSGGIAGLGAVGKAFASAGLGLAIGGVLQLVTPVPRLDTQPEETNPEASKYISGTGNTTKIGTRIPLAYGTFPIYGQLLSVNVQSKDISTGPYGGSPLSPYDPNYRYGYNTGSINAF